MKDITNEVTFEDNIEISLTSSKNGYVKGNPSDFQPDLALDTKKLLEFIQSSQLKKWQELSEIHREEVETKFLQRLVRELELRGTLDCLRNGVTDYGVTIDLAYFKPESKLNPETQELYEKNILSVTRQVHFSLKDPDKSLDLVLFLNGLPVATVELKNPFTGQTVSNAKNQYTYTRDHTEPLLQFKKRALVHFAVDPNEVYMTTKLQGENTKFLPFNKGFENGAGNPPSETAYNTSYLWEYVWSKDSWMDILAKFISLEKKEIKANGQKIEKETLIFPRFHQLDVVRKLAEDTKLKGTGNNYLIQHSAGSGKSNSIAWLAYRLSNLHDENDKNIFDSIIVVTDRVVLDKQLQDTIYQFEHKQGVVQKIDKTSKQLAEALKKGTKIIITTVQKFPIILDEVNDLKNKKFAVIVDEAHSSQGGETSKKMKEVLTSKTLEEAEQEEIENDDNFEDEIRESMMARGKQANLSFYAFTATPKAKTLEVFGTTGENGLPHPFHLYSMRQAIEEGFILDVLKNYTTYKTYFRISKAIEEDPKVNKEKANRAIARFLSLHPHNISQKTEIMIEHFKKVSANKIGGKAKAMVVTSSRLHAVRYYKEFNRYIKEKGYDSIKTLVAFSGTVIDDSGIHYKELEMNGFREKELPEKFNADEYRILLVADKYQTGFDQPLLHTMYVDKKLSGVKAVQTLSRLNRTAPGKEDTFILDFANEQTEILEAFQPYYELATIQETTDPNHLYDLKHKLEDNQVYWQSEVDSFTKIFFKKYQTRADQPELYRIIQPAIDRYIQLENTQKEEFKKLLIEYVRTYAFLTQIMPFQDVELEKLYGFVRLLRNALPKDTQERFELNDEIALAYYRIQKVQEGNIKLESNSESSLPASIKDAELLTAIDDDEAALSEIIKKLNERLGENLTEADKLLVEQVEADMLANKTLAIQAKNNDIEHFKYGFDDKLMDTFIERMEQNEELFKKFIGDSEVKKIISEYLLKRVYKKLNKTISIKQLIKEGENQNLEFKSSLRWDVKLNKTNKDLEKVILKTIVGFMNSEGGQLLIGVEDDGKIFGLEKDYEALNGANRDKFQNHITQLVKMHLGTQFVHLINFLFEKIQNKDVCLLTITHSSKPIFLKYKDQEEFYARTGNSTSPFSLMETQEYIKIHWKD